MAQLRGGGEPSFAPPPSLDSSMIMIVDHLLSNFVNEEKIPKNFFGASRIISDKIFNCFLFFDLRKVMSFLIKSSLKNLYICYLLANKDRRTSIRKTIMAYRQTKYIVKYCQELLNT